MATAQVNPQIRRHNEVVLGELQEGDLIEFQRAMYSHWAVYIGDLKVVHLTGENDGIGDGKGDPKKFCSPCGIQLSKAWVQIDLFWDVAGNSKALKNNNKDRKHRPLSPAEIVERALSKLGHIGYNVIWKNCEHFASWCRYNVEWSEQADNALTGLGFGVAAAALGAIAVGLIKSFTGESKEKSKQQRRA